MTTSSPAQTTPPVGAIASKVDAAARRVAERRWAIATLSEAAGWKS